MKTTKTKSFYITFLFFFSLTTYLNAKLLEANEEEEEPVPSDTKINLTDYSYPKQDLSSDIIRIAILGTNDLHGEVFHTKLPDKDGNRFSQGGGNYIYSYAKILKEEWGPYFLWLDGGDQFQGTMECMLSDCFIMKDFSNFVGIDATTIGNHEFDYGIDIFLEHLKQRKFPTLCANIFDKQENKYVWEEGMWENVYPYKIFEIGEIKIGVIGLATQETPASSATNLTRYEFRDYFEITKNFTEKLINEEKVDSVILLAHFGPKCLSDNDKKMELKMRDKSTEQEICEDNYEIIDFLKQLKEEGVPIDAVVGAHVHDVVHHWISDIPVIESTGSPYFNMLYLPFKKNGETENEKNNFSVNLLNDKIEMEGPIPVCEKLWPDTKKCDFRMDKSSSEMKNFYFHNQEIIIDEKIMEELDYWYEIILDKLSKVLAKSTTELKQSSKKNIEAALSNFVVDVGRKVTDSDICFYNTGGIRSSWYVGDINEIDVFKMFPFNNTWYRFEMTGSEVMRMLRDLNYFSVYPSSGIFLSLKKNNDEENSIEVVDVNLWDGVNESPIEKDKIYKICTNDYLAQGGSRMGVIRKWYKELRNGKECGVIRDSFTNYLKQMKIINEYFYIDKNYPRFVFVD